MVPAGLPELVKRCEGFAKVVRLKPTPMAIPYVCPAGYWTIGYGELCQPDTAPQTEPYASERLQAVLLPAYVAHAFRLSPVLLGASEARQAAIADFIYNLGPTRYAASTLRRVVAVGNWTAAAAELRKWVYGGGRVLPGLVLRRELEAELILRG